MFSPMPKSKKRVSPDLSRHFKLASYLKVARKLQGLTQSDLAALMRERGCAGYCQQKVSDVEIYGSLSAVEFLLLCDVLSIDAQKVKL
jgi:hypothetical protein